MDSAKEIARDMLEAISLDDSGFIVNAAKGFISFPVSMFYLGYDFLDAEHRSANLNDKFRLAALIKRGLFRREIFEKVYSVFINDFTSRIDVDKATRLVGGVGGSLLGSFAFSQLTGVRLGAAITQNAVGAFFASVVSSSLLYVGAEGSRAIYTSRALKEQNPRIYQKLRSLGDLDLLYYLVKKRVEPFEAACTLHEVNPAEFDKLCEYFFNGLSHEA